MQDPVGVAKMQSVGDLLTKLETFVRLESFARIVQKLLQVSTSNVFENDLKRERCMKFPIGSWEAGFREAPPITPQIPM